jgi:hypothetical protein
MTAPEWGPPLGPSPTITTPNIIGVTNGSAPVTGTVGEPLSPTNLTGVSLTSGAAASVSSVILAPGDYMIGGTVAYNGTVSTIQTQATQGISTTSSALGATGTFSTLFQPATANQFPSVPVPLRRINVSVTTTVFLVAFPAFTASTLTASGFMYGWRIH